MTKVSPVKDFFAGGFGGMCLVASGHPFDTIKVRLQTMPQPKPGESAMYRGMLDCFAKTVRSEGVFAIYKGMAAPLVGVAPMFAVCFFGYGVGKKLFQSAPDAELTLLQIAGAGCVSGVFTTPIMVPGERIKCILQVQQGSKSEAKYKGPVDCAKQLFRTGGIQSIYRGTMATLLRDVPGSAVYFFTYEALKRSLTPEGKTTADLGPARLLLAGGTSGIFTWVWNICPDVLKSRLQTAPDGTYQHGIRSVFREIMQKEGVASLYRGIVPVMVRAFPANAACFVGYEFATKLLNMAFP